ncbi:diacylglycerol kinase kappa-like [Trichoplusia ni]|uniref:Diacylglycerol kinase kappa-like n=1 Tax=Trichoplusia ni TaxID=7111 RepID=A0A7E5W2F3_TRINI|nr:diacylglycerol kinase kappa-like [Trichoplusia ni]
MEGAAEAKTESGSESEAAKGPCTEASGTELSSVKEESIADTQSSQVIKEESFADTQSAPAPDTKEESAPETKAEPAPDTKVESVAEPETKASTADTCSEDQCQIPR